MSHLVSENKSISKRKHFMNTMNSYHKLFSEKDPYQILFDWDMNVPLRCAPDDDDDDDAPFA